MQAADCSAETPLPQSVAIIPPTPSVPEDQARFVGSWVGVWQDRGQDALCHTLVVKSVWTDASAEAIYSHGRYRGWNIHQADYYEVPGAIKDGKLVLAFRTGSKATYWFDGEKLKGHYETSRGSTSDIVMIRRTDGVSQ